MIRTLYTLGLSKSALNLSSPKKKEYKNLYILNDSVQPIQAIHLVEYTCWIRQFSKPESALIRKMQNSQNVTFRKTFAPKATRAKSHTVKSVV